MNTVYDLFLNFQDYAFEFFEWQRQDEIEHIKKIPLFRVKTEMMEDLLIKKIKVTTDFLKIIYNLTERYDLNKLEYSCCFSDGKIAIAIEFNEEGYSMYKSRMLLEDEEEICKYAIREEEINLEYEVMEEKLINPFFTRHERKVKKFLEREITKIYQQKEYSKLQYLYLEYFEILEENKNKMKEALLDSMKDSLNEKHFELYELLLILSKKKKV